MSKTTGIRTRHSRNCPARGGGKCGCVPSVEAFVWSKEDGKKIRRTFRGRGAHTAAKAWRSETHIGVRDHTIKAPTRELFRDAAQEWLDGAESGAIRKKKGGEAYKPSTVRGYSTSLTKYILPELGAARLTEIRRVHLDDVVERLQEKGADPSTIRNALMPVRAIYRRALSRGVIAVNPTAGLELPAVEGTRDRTADPVEATQLLAALPVEDRAVWATALYAGLRRGELMALRWESVNLASGIIRVERSWDMKVGPVATKSKKGKRKVPVPAVLRDFLDDLKLRCAWDEGLVFGIAPESPFDPYGLRKRARAAWKTAKLTPIGLHECRHSFASMMIAAGVNAKALSTYLGHSSITITLDRYGHLFPGNEEEAAGLLDAFLVRANTAARLAQVTAAPAVAGLER
jgi:integrase